MGIFEEFERFCNKEQNRVEVPTVNVYDPDYIKERIRVTKNNQIRNRFRLSNERRFAVRVTGLDHMTHEPVSVMDCYLLGELCMTRHPQFYTKPIKYKNYIIFEDEAVINGARNYVKNHCVEIAPEKWSLFGRAKHSILVNISPFKTSGDGIRLFVYKMDLEVAEWL